MQINVANVMKAFFSTVLFFKRKINKNLKLILTNQAVNRLMYENLLNKRCIVVNEKHVKLSNKLALF